MKKYLPVVLLLALVASALFSHRGLAAPSYAVDDEYTVALLHLNGENNSTTITDESGKIWAVAGDAKIKTDQYKFGASSAYLDGSGDYLYTADSADWNLGTGNFTIDAWVRFNNISENRDIVSHKNTGTDLWHFWIWNGGQLSFRDSSTGLDVHAGANNLTINEWHHVAVVRSGTSFYFFVDGQQSGTTQTSSAGVHELTGALYVGADSNPSSNYSGYIDELRVSKGIARWTSNFTPPTTEYEPAPPTETPTPTATFTPTNTVSPTLTPTHTGTVTRTPTFTPTVTNTPVPGSYIIWASSSLTISDPMSLAIESTLLSAPPEDAEGFIYGIINIQSQDEGWFISLANLPDLAPPYEDWNFMEDAQWVGSLLCSGTEPNWVCVYYDPPRGGNDTSLVFPWRPGTNALYGPLGVHAGYSSLGSDSKAVDFVGGDNYGSNIMPAYAYAAADGVVTGICRDANNIAVKLSGAAGDFVYLHLATGNNYDYGESYAQGEQIGSLRYGSFSGGVCGWASQSSSTYHLHFAFVPSGDYFTIGGCNLHISTQQWLCGTDTISVNGMLYNGGGKEDPPIPGEPIPPDIPTFGGEHIWNNILYAAYTFFANPLAALLPDHDTRIDLFLDRGRYVLHIIYELTNMFVFGPNLITSNLMTLVISTIMTGEIVYWVLSFVFSVGSGLTKVAALLTFLGIL